MNRLSALVLLFAGCSGGPVDVMIPVEALFAGSAVRCGMDLTLPGGATGEFADARVFLSNVEMQNTDGAWVSVDLTPSDWQNDNVVLLDFEDGTAGCSDSGTPETNGSIVGTLPAGEYTGLRFDIGVPFQQNHVNNATEPAPMNAPGMFWTWQGGYKFVRVDFLVDGDPGTRWNVHVGSTACVSDAPVDAPATACDRPNRASLEIATVGPTSGLSLDLQALVSTVDLAQNSAETPPGCMSSPMEPLDCIDTFASLGLDFSSGACVSGCADQSFVAVTP